MAQPTLQVQVTQVVDEAVDVRSFRLETPDGEPLMPFQPGSHIDVHLPGGMVRQYSLCTAPDHSRFYRIAVKREAQSRGGSAAMHELRIGSTVTISAPRNNFPLQENADHTVLIAGGIGITPLLSMALDLKARERSFELQYFSRSLAHTAFHAVLSEPSLAGSVGFHYALEPEAVRAYLRKRLWHHQSGAHLYICGPRPFMDLVEQTAAMTWPPETVHLEYFQADPASLAGPRDAFTVRAGRSGKECVVTADQTIVQALKNCGVHVETSCEQGVCGTCLTGVLEGVPDHRDVYLTDEEHSANERITPCVSRSMTSVLVLDL